MGSEGTQRAIERVQGELEGLHRQLTDVTREEARKADRIGQLTRDIATTKNASLAQMKERELQSRQRDVSRLQSKRADITRHISDKTSELHRHQQQLYREQTSEQRNALSRIQKDFEKSQREQLQGLRSRIGTVAEEEDPGVFDAFICHATEDKEELVRPLAEKLTKAGFRVWYDEFQLKVGDSLRRSIDKGLSSSRFGIVVLSPFFFAKNWPQYELDGLVAREVAGGKVILPLWHKVSKDEILSYSPSLADKVALNTANYTVDELVAKLAQVLGSE